jgi:hypothetical protein
MGFSLFAQPGSGSTGAYSLLTIFILLFYFVPVIVGAIRKVPNVGSVFVINLFLGWTFIGWVVALAMAARTAPAAEGKKA